MDLASLLSQRRDDVLRIAERHGARNVRVFGSIARGTATSTSDVDLLVEMDPGRTLLDHAALKQELEELLGVRVDVVTEAALHWSIRDQVLDEAVGV